MLTESTPNTLIVHTDGFHAGLLTWATSETKKVSQTILKLGCASKWQHKWTQMNIGSILAYEIIYDVKFPISEWARDAFIWTKTSNQVKSSLTNLKKNNMHQTMGIQICSNIHQWKWYKIFFIYKNNRDYRHSFSMNT